MTCKHVPVCKILLIAISIPFTYPAAHSIQGVAKISVPDTVLLSLQRRAKNIFMVFQKAVLGERPKRWEVTWAWRKLRDDELRNLYSSPNGDKMKEHETKHDGDRNRPLGRWRRTGLSNVTFLPGFPTKFVRTVNFYLSCATCSAHLISAVVDLRILSRWINRLRLVVV